MVILVIGDIVGKPGRNAIKAILPSIKDSYNIDYVIGNGENAAHGIGITKSITEELLENGIDVITSGNHIFKVKETFTFIKEFPGKLLRPANFPPGLPGDGISLREKDGVRYAVVNLHGRVFIKEDYDCPFRKADEILNEIKDKADIIIVDFHAEATSEKAALGRYLDGRVSAVVGTHTHVQTADEQLLKHGTAFITDIGMTGPHDSVIGMREQEIFERFTLQILNKFEVAKDDVKLQGILLYIDCREFKPVKLERISINLKS
ncbi:MAG: TIGR00282 family metallophosphoesterase [bacterium]|nr:TIGR00282 family metallophosphoesterase [bacterium]